MKKLALELDGLEVESFATDIVAGEEEGTVQGHQMNTRRDSCLRTFCCPHTFEPSCADTCTC